MYDKILILLFNVINKNGTTGAITESGFSVNSTGQLISMGTRKIQSFAGTLASTDAASTAYADGDCLVELGTLNVDAPDGLVTLILPPLLSPIPTSAKSARSSLKNRYSSTSG